jgi:rod shape-determining protein MreC
MYRKQVRRRRAVLVMLVVLCLALISTHFSEGESGPLHTLQNGVGAALGPVEDVANRALKPVRDLVGWFDETFEARSENDELREQVQELRQELADSEGAIEQNRELRRITRLTDDGDLASFEPRAANVVGRSPSTWNQVLRIDIGRRDGVGTDDAVVNGDGLVGRVSSTSAGSARVTLLTDQRSAVTARVQGGGPNGIVGAEVGDPTDLIFELIADDREVKRGARLVTAGFTDGPLSSRFPPGIPIGEVKEVNPGEQDLRQRVHVEPYADLTDLTVVSVLTGGSS